MFAGRTEDHACLMSLDLCVYKMTLPSSVQFVWSTRRCELLREPGFFCCVILLIFAEACDSSYNT